MKKKFLSHCLLAFALSGLACSTSLGATTVLNESFPAGQRETQNLPTTAAWYATFNSGFSYSAGNLSSDDGRYLLSYFTDSGAINLAEGESLNVNFSVAVNTPGSVKSGLRIGVLNSGGSRIDDDGEGLSNSIYNGYTGYMAGLNINSDTALGLYERIPGLDPGSNSLIHSASNCYATLGSNIGTGATFTSGTYYDVSFTLAHTASGMELSVTMTDFAGYSGTLTDTTDITTGFDTFVIYGAPNAMETYSMSDIEITYNAIPEPSSSNFALFAVALLALGLRASRRRRD